MFISKKYIINVKNFQYNVKQDNDVCGLHCVKKQVNAVAKQQRRFQWNNMADRPRPASQGVSYKLTLDTRHNLRTIFLLILYNMLHAVFHFTVILMAFMKKMSGYKESNFKSLLTVQVGH